MSFSSPSHLPPSGLNAEAARLEQRQLDDRAARGHHLRAARGHHLRAAGSDSLHRMVARVRTALRAHRSTG
jgi:hypothetical protein